MQFIPYRNLRNEPATVRKQLSSEGELVVTNGGKPFALMIDIPENENVDEILLMASRIRAQMAIRSIRSNARKNGTNKLTDDQINEVIQKTREDRE
ncbi:MAG: hypothetical protein ACYDH2_06285 [Anaerolineaceae bacterium]|nr:MAG: hypothetical protein CVU45_01360 [Chloroflexi bacterium HGW-Chloroflexi-7]HCS40243.1 hypothetical protein [Anaerolineaceae bacterium]